MKWFSSHFVPCLVPWLNPVAQNLTKKKRKKRHMYNLIVSVLHWTGGVTVEFMLGVGVTCSKWSPQRNQNRILSARKILQISSIRAVTKSENEDVDLEMFDLQKKRTCERLTQIQSVIVRVAWCVMSHRRRKVQPKQLFFILKSEREVGWSERRACTI